MGNQELLDEYKSTKFRFWLLRGMGWLCGLGAIFLPGLVAQGQPSGGSGGDIFKLFAALQMFPVSMILLILGVVLAVAASRVRKQLVSLADGSGANVSPTAAHDFDAVDKSDPNTTDAMMGKLAKPKSD